MERLLAQLISNGEHELVEFKNVTDNYSTSKIGKYFSALANEANLRSIEKAWLIFGVDDKTKKVVGTDYRMQKDRLQALKIEISSDTKPSITFRNIHELQTGKGRVILFEIPAAPQGMPVAWKGHYYGRAGESLTSLGLDKQDEIRDQNINTDWTAQVVKDATFDHLDARALLKAKESFARKYANRFSQDEINSWSEESFLDRAKLTQDRGITRAALLLVGKPESAYLLGPHPAQITWKLAHEGAYEHFQPPFLLNTTSLYQKIRNFQVRILPPDALLPVEVSKYDQKVVLEALHNCIAHQDYYRNGRIIVTELSDKLAFENEGGFYEGVPSDYILGHKTPRRYRNAFLVQAMVELNMIDTMGYGIHKMHITQARRYFPMPDYDLSEGNAVKMTIYGKVVDPSYSRLLIERGDLSLEDILALDRVQKKLSLPDDKVKQLRRAGLIEGRRPNLHVSALVAKVTAKKAEYIRTRAQDDTFYAKLIIDYLTKFKKASREEMNHLLWDKLSETLDEEQKTNKIANLLTNLRRAGRIYNTASRKSPCWELKHRNAE